MNKLLLGKIIAIIVIVGVVGAVSSLYFHFWNPSWNPFTEKPEVVLAKMMRNLEKVKTYHMEGDGIIDLKTKEAQYSPKIEIEIKGDEDQSDKSNSRSYSDIKGSLSVQGMSFNGEIESIGIGETFYIRVKEFPFTIFSFFSGEDLSNLANVVENRWIKFDPESLKRFYESKGITGFPENKEKQKEMIEKIIRILKNKEWVKVRENKGGERIDGKSYYHYLLTINKEALKQSLPEIIRIGMEYSSPPVSLTPQQLDEANSAISKSVDELFQKIGDIDFDIWISMENKLPYKITFAKNIDMSKFKTSEYSPLGGIEGINVEGEVVFSDFGKKINIQVPKESKDFDEFMRRLNNAFYSGGGPYSKAREARITSDLDQARSIAEVIYARDNAYSLLCSGNEFNGDDKDYGVGLSLINNDISQLGSKITCYASNVNYCAFTDLDNNSWYCIDSVGRALETNIYPGSSGYCDGITFKCPSNF